MTSENTNGGSITVPDDPFLDVDLIEVDDLINSATRLLDEVFSNRPMPVPLSAALSPREDAMQQVQRFLSSIRDPESPSDDDVVFVGARPGNALPSDARTTAVVDLCTPGNDDTPASAPRPPTRRRGRYSGAALAPQALFRDNTPDCSEIPSKTRRRQPKKEPGSTAAPVIINDSISSVNSVDGALSSPDANNGNLPRLICAVCMESVVNRKPSSTSCGHIFCQLCIREAIRLTKKCPLCNSKLKLSQVHRVYF